jgi:hypothetical protein
MAANGNGMFAAVKFTVCHVREREREREIVREKPRVGVDYPALGQTHLHNDFPSTLIAIHYIY